MELYVNPKRPPMVTHRNQVYFKKALAVEGVQLKTSTYESSYYRCEVELTKTYD